MGKRFNFFNRNSELGIRGCTTDIKFPFSNFCSALVFLFLKPVSKPLARISFETRNGVLMEDIK